jgi:hypothetical protein
MKLWERHFERVCKPAPEECELKCVPETVFQTSRIRWLSFTTPDLISQGCLERMTRIEMSARREWIIQTNGRSRMVKMQAADKGLFWPRRGEQHMGVLSNKTTSHGLAKDSVTHSHKLKAANGPICVCGESRISGENSLPQ